MLCCCIEGADVCQTWRCVAAQTQTQTNTTNSQQLPAPLYSILPDPVAVSSHVKLVSKTHFSPKYSVPSCKLCSLSSTVCVSAPPCCKQQSSVHPFLDALPLPVVMAAIFLLACMKQGFRVSFYKTTRYFLRLV